MTENLKEVSGKEFLSLGPSLYVWLLVHDAWESESPSGDQAISDLRDSSRPHGCSKVSITGKSVLAGPHGSCRASGKR